MPPQRRLGNEMVQDAEVAQKSLGAPPRRIEVTVQLSPVPWK